VAQTVTMPQLGESVTEGTIVRWLKAEGDDVERDEPLCEIDTDKVSAELPSPFAGTLEQRLVPEGTTVAVGTEIATMAVAGAAEVAPEEAAEAEFPTVADTETEERSVAAVSAGGNGRGVVEDAETLRLTRSSPVVRRLAREHEVDLEEVEGSGIGGRVTKGDIEAFIEDGGARRAAPEQEPVPERVEVRDGDRVLEVTGIRRAIANRMSLSKREAPHAWAMVEVDVTGLVALRREMQAGFYEREGARLTYLPFIVEAAVEGLRQNPVLNSVWDGGRILLRKDVHVGIAVDLGDALIVPVVRDAGELNLSGLARRIDDVVGRARSGELTPDDVSGGTFTVNNPGALGSVISTPIINHPQAAILSAEAIVRRPVVVQTGGAEAIAIRSMMNLEVSFDHRILDGGVALRFLNAVKRRLERYGSEGGPG
jgi:2-oxoisovalerate dehydrogenase E2 component (dihydrolipoyl transacylase)